MEMNKITPQINSLYLLFVMLDILDLAPDPLRQKWLEREAIDREAYGIAILDRLKERNLMNELLIIKFIKKNRKKKVKSKFTLPICQGLPEALVEVMISEFQKAESARRAPSKSQPKAEDTPELTASNQEIIKSSELKTTSNTANGLLSEQLHNLTQSNALNLLEHVSDRIKRTATETMNNARSPANSVNTFTRYLRNFFISRLTQNVRIKDKQTDHKLTQSRKQENKTKSQMENEIKSKIKVKSLVFGQSEIDCARDGNTIELPKNARLHTDSETAAKNSNRYDKLFENSAKQKKGALPTIHNSLAARNKRCLQNYIQRHQDKSRCEKSLDFRTVKLPTEAELVYHEGAEGSRKTSWNKLAALHVRKA